MKVLSIFDGISGAQLALTRLGIPIESYHSFEINPHSMFVTHSNFPHTIQLGDVTQDGLFFAKNRYDLIVFGSPCTDLSIAHKNRQSLAGKNSGLFYTALDVLKRVQSKFFLMENVASMSQESREEISRLLGVQPVQINSKHFTGQNRERLYWFNWNIPTVVHWHEPFHKRLLLPSYINELRSQLELSKGVIAYMDSWHVSEVSPY